MPQRYGATGKNMENRSELALPRVSSDFCLVVVSLLNTDMKRGKNVVETHGLELASPNTMYPCCQTSNGRI